MTILQVLDQQLAPGNSLGLLELLEDVKSGSEKHDLKTRAVSWISILNGKGAVAPPPAHTHQESKPAPHTPQTNKTEPHNKGGG